jgi:hypothetical protein
MRSGNGVFHSFGCAAVESIVSLSGVLVKFFFARVNFSLHLVKKRVYCASKNESGSALGRLLDCGENALRKKMRASHFILDKEQ